jgi:glycosyltransferase involved in cell wall biosynthesis
VLRVPKAGKRAAIAAGLNAADPSTDVVVVLDSDTVWARGALAEMLRPFADPRVGGVTPRQAIFDVGDDSVRRLADWIEDLRYLLTVPAQSVFGQVGCLAGRTIAYRREAFELGPGGGFRHLAMPFEIALAYAGMLVSIGVRQIPHLRRRPRDVPRHPLFVLRLTFVMVPVRILAFATMLHQSWSSRPAALS